MKYTDTQRPAAGRFIRRAAYALIPVGLYLGWMALPLLRTSGKPQQAAPAPPPFRPVVLAPGQILQLNPSSTDTSVPRHGWLALTKKNNQWSLVPTDIDLQAGTVMPTQDGAVLFLRGEGLSAGTAAADQAQAFDPGVDKDMAKPAMQLSFNQALYDLHLSREGQVILSDANEQHPTVLDSSKPISVKPVWAGDLDRDGKLDLVVRLGNEHEDVICLFLSTAAHEGQLLRLAGCSSAHDPKLAPKKA